MTAALAVSALRNAIALRATRRHAWCIRTGAANFGPHAFVRTLRSHGLTGSMGRVGACADNAAMESFFALLQKNVLDRQRWHTRERAAPRHRHLDRADLPPPAPPARLGRLTPIEFETLHQAAHAA